MYDWEVIDPHYAQSEGRSPEYVGVSNCSLRSYVLINLVRGGKYYFKFAVALFRLPLHFDPRPEVHLLGPDL